MQEPIDKEDATYIPDATQTVNRFLLDLSRDKIKTPVLTSLRKISILQQWFSFIHLFANI